MDVICLLILSPPLFVHFLVEYFYVRRGGMYCLTFSPHLISRSRNGKKEEEKNMARKRHLALPPPPPPPPPPTLVFPNARSKKRRRRKEDRMLLLLFFAGLVYPSHYTTVYIVWLFPSLAGCNGSGVATRKTLPSSFFSS